MMLIESHAPLDTAYPPASGAMMANNPPDLILFPVVDSVQLVKPADDAGSIVMLEDVVLLGANHMNFTALKASGDPKESSVDEYRSIVLVPLPAMVVDDT